MRRGVLLYSGLLLMAFMSILVARIRVSAPSRRWSFECYSYNHANDHNNNNTFDNNNNSNNNIKNDTDNDNYDNDNGNRFYYRFP